MVNLVLAVVEMASFDVAGECVGVPGVSTPSYVLLQFGDYVSSEREGVVEDTGRTCFLRKIPDTVRSRRSVGRQRHAPTEHAPHAREL